MKIWPTFWSAKRHSRNYTCSSKAIYRDLLSVRKNDSGEVEVISMIFDAESLGEGGQLFGKAHQTNFCYLIVDPVVRHITMWRFEHKSAWG